jgi:hypothetical protein
MARVAADIAQVLALIAAGIYFVWRFYRGWFVTNLRIGIETSRLPANDEQDHLAVKVKLTKGGLGGTLNIHDAVILVEGATSDHRQAVQLHEIRRYERDLDPSDPHRYIIDFGRYSTTRFPRTRLPPEDEMTLAGYVTVPTGLPYFVHAFVLGGVRDRISGQWHSSEVSLPVLHGA